MQPDMTETAILYEERDKAHTLHTRGFLRTMSTRRTTRKRAAEIAKQKLSAVKKTDEQQCAWQAVEIKLEELDEESAVDIKPDVNELQKQLLLAQRESPSAAVVVPSLTSATKTGIPVPDKHLLFIGDVACVATTEGASLTLTPLTTNAITSNVAYKAATEVNKVCTDKKSRNSKIGILNSSKLTSNITVDTKILDDYFEKDEIDLQESDSDEDGYSEIDFEEEDEVIEDDDEEDIYDPMWTDQSTAPRKVFPFNMNSLRDIGLLGRPKSVCPVFYFDKMIGDREEFFRQLAQSCNERAQEMHNVNIIDETPTNEITSEEIQVFFGLCLQMSSLKLPSISEYWNDKSYIGFKGFASKMNQNRFQTCLRVLSFERLSEENHNEGLFKTMGPLIEFFNRRMNEIYKCGQRLVLNEPIVFWKGKINWLKDLKDKFRYNAITLHFLTENTGLLLKIVPDVETKDRKVCERNSKLLVSQRIGMAKALLKEKLNYGHTLFTSKYYSSYGLGLELSEYQTYCTGMLDNKRYGNSKQLVLTRLSNYQFATKYANPIMMGKWCRRDKSVYFFSSDCLAISAKETSRYNSDPRPKIIKELNWQLNLPVNIRDYMSYYQSGLDRKEIKWDRQLAIYIFNLFVLNAYIFYTMHAQFGRARIIELHLKDTTKLKSYLEFRGEIIASLLNAHEDLKEVQSHREEVDNEECEHELIKNSAKSITTTDNVPFDIQHVPMVIPKRKGKVRKKKCRVCRRGGMLTFSKTCCELCPGMPGLCEIPCFRIWHDKLQKTFETGEHMNTFGISYDKTILN